MSEREFCTAEREGNILVVTINRPAQMNALHPPANAELAAIFDEFERVKMFTGSSPVVLRSASSE